MILTGWFILSGVLATVFATSPTTHCANSTNVATCKIQGIVCNDNAKTNQIRQSILEAKQLAQVVLDFLDIEGVGHNLYQAYWPPGQATLDFVRDAFIAIAIAQEEDRIFGCDADPANACNGDTVASYVSGNIYYCNQSHLDFFTQGPNCNLCGPNRVPVNSRRIRGGSTLHELARSFDGPGHILDYAYGCPQAQLLAPQLKVHNADNYHCFALAAFALTGCGQCPPFHV